MLAPYGPPVLPGIAVLVVPAVGSTTRRPPCGGRGAREPRLTITSLAVPVVLPIVCFVLLVVGGVASSPASHMACTCWRPAAPR
jgi:hypothetical protein